MLAKAIATSNSTKIADTTRQLMKSDIEYIRSAVTWALGDVPSISLPALREILADNAHFGYHGRAISSMAKAGGASVGPELIEVVKNELKFWQKVGPTLGSGWWNGAAGAIKWEEVERLRNNYMKANYAIEALKDTRFKDGRASIVDFRDFWQSLPQLAEIDQMGKLCDETLMVLK